MTQAMMIQFLPVLMVLSAMQVQADDAAVLNLQMAPTLNGSVHDGQMIGHGQISTQQPHRGYHVWIEARKSGDAPNHYIITGRNNPQHELRVVVGQDGWMPDTKEGKGIVILTEDSLARFDIVAEGSQSIEADDYSLMAGGTILTR